METTIEKEEDGQIHVYQYTHTRKLTDSEKIKTIFNIRGYLVIDCKTETDGDGFRVEFKMKQDCDIFQSHEAEKLKEMGLYISCVHPYPEGDIMRYVIHVTPFFSK